jgi:sugar diacid utilization regulator
MVPRYVNGGPVSELTVAELRRRRALMDDLVTGTDDSSAYARAHDLGYDLHAPHWMIVTQYQAGTSDTALARSVERAAELLQMGPLLSRRAELVLLLAQRPAPRAAGGLWSRLYEEVRKLLPGPTVEIGVGGSCEQPSDVPRSWREALRALAVRGAEPGGTGGITVYADLRIDSVLPLRADRVEAEEFVRRWLGPVREHDAQEGSELVETLATYIRHAGELTAAARDLRVHRSTVRYRMHLITSLSLRGAADIDGTGPDVRDHRNWPSLQTAVWVSRILDAARWGAP